MSREIMLDGVTVNDDSDCYVIAEIGHNHQGKMDQCKELFDIAKQSGANAVKLQKRNNRALFTKAMYESPYTSYNAFADTYGEHRDYLEFGHDEYEELRDYAREIGISFFSTAFDQPSVEFLENLEMPFYKMASGDLTNIPLIETVAQTGKPMIISTGGGTMNDVRRAYEAARKHNDQVAILQCTAGYPPSWEELNIRVIATYREEFRDAVCGFSSHDNGIAMATAAYVLGSRIVEKHFTLNRAMKGTDHAFSLEHAGLEKMVRDLKRCRVSLGDGIKRRYESEETPLYKMSKKIVVASDLPKGHVITEDDLLYKCPNDGLAPYEAGRVIGKRLSRDLSFEENLSFADLEDHD